MAIKPTRFLTPKAQHPYEQFYRIKVAAVLPRESSTTKIQIYSFHFRISSKCMYGYAPHGNIGLTFPSLPKEESNPLAKCQSTMEVNILVMVLSSNESMDMIFIWRVNRSEISLRPPPGGPMADTNS